MKLPSLCFSGVAIFGFIKFYETIFEFFGSREAIGFAKLSLSVLDFTKYLSFWSFTKQFSGILGLANRFSGNRHRFSGMNYPLTKR